MQRLAAEGRVLLRLHEIWPRSVGALAVLDGANLRPGVNPAEVRAQTLAAGR